jgi:hypothetical protein
MGANLIHGARRLGAARAADDARWPHTRDSWQSPTKGAEPAQKVELPLAEPRDVDEAFRSGQNREQVEQQDFVEGTNHLARLTSVRQVIDILLKYDRLADRRKSRRRRLHRRSPPIESVDHDRFGASVVCHELPNPIALTRRFDRLALSARRR